MRKAVFDPAYQSKHIEGKIVAALERIAEAFRVLLWNEGKDVGLSPVQIQILIFLLHHAPEACKVTYLADEFNMTKATISDSVKSLLQKGLIAKTAAPHDSRSFTIALTEEGRMIALQTMSFANALHTPVHKLSEDAQAQLYQSLIGIIQHLNTAGIVTVQRMCFNCTHYRKDFRGNPHFCQLMNKKLAASELRIDCPEHAPAARS